MHFADPLEGGVLVRRYQRFLADVALENGTTVTAHCPNTGSMMGCCDPGSPVWLSRSGNPRRKHSWTWELVEPHHGVCVGIHTGRANALVGEALEAELLPELGHYPRRRREVRVPGAPMRADWLLEDPDGGGRCFLEVKNVTAAVHGRTALFPDAVTERGRRHVEVLGEWVAQGGRAALVFCVQRNDVTELRPADAIDPRYGEALRGAVAQGLWVAAVAMEVGPRAIAPRRRVPVRCDPDGGEPGRMEPGHEEVES